MWTIDNHTRKDKGKKENPPTVKKRQRHLLEREQRYSVSCGSVGCCGDLLL
jgi:hypothetical protein